MMKNLVLFVTLAFLAAYVSGAVLQRQDKAEPLEIIETFEDIDLTTTPFDFSRVIDTKNGGLLFSGNYVSGPNEIIRVLTITVSFATHVRISSVQTSVDQSAIVTIPQGGVGTNYVTIRTQSQPGRGFNLSYYIYGFENVVSEV